MALTQVQSGLLESGAALNNIGAGTITPSYLNTQAQYTGFKNRIINGDMTISQRNGTSSVNANSSTAPYTTDRFNVNVGGSSAVIACQQVSDAPAGFVNSLRLTVSTAATPSSGQFLFLRQIIEGVNIADFAWGTANASAVALSFWVKASVAGTYSAFAINSAESRSYVATFTVSATNTWEYKTITIPGDTTGTWLTNNSNGIRLGFDLGSGSDLNGAANTWQSGWKQRTSGTVNWVGTSGATFQVTGVQLEKGSTATSFDYRPYGTEFYLCKRYYEQKDYTSGSFEAICAGTVPSTGTSTNTTFPFTYEVEKRAVPSITLSAGSTFRVNGGNVADNQATSNSVGIVGKYTFQLELQSGVSRNSGMSIWASRQLTETCFIRISAEL